MLYFCYSLRAKLFALAIIISVISPVYAQVAVSKMILDMPYDRPPVANVDVYNTDELRPLRVEVVSRYMSKPEDDADEGTTEGALLVSPRAFTIPPKGQRTIRLVLRERPTDKEKVFRLALIPKATEDSTEDSLESQGQKKTQEGLKLRILFGVGLLIFATPKDKQVTFAWYSKDNKVFIKNQGTVNALLVSAKICKSQDKCEEKQVGNRLYVSEQIELETKSFTAIELKLEKLGGGFQTVNLQGVEGTLTIPVN